MAKISRVEVARLDYALVGDFKFFKGKQRPSVLVRLTDDSGMQGLGQAVPVETWTYETTETVQTTLEHYLAPAVLGADPSDLADVHARMERAIRPSFSVGQPLAKAAIDLACHDLWGKQAGRSVGELLGGRQTEDVKLSWTVNATTLNKAEEQLEQGRTAGYDSFNVKIGPPQTADYDSALIHLVSRFERRGFHWADANTSYQLDTGKQMAVKLADAGFRALESPLPPNRIRDYQALKRQGALPILMDEGIVSPVEAEEFAALGMLDGIAMKVARCGGLWHASRIVQMLKERELLIFASGLTDPQLSLAASLHLFSFAALDRPAALNGPQYLAGHRASGDRVRVPDGPGLGVEIQWPA
ncbi:MAG TPA: enolase C-terminal domain-like protein [Burkholderiales bacterium]|nr:enolase C-terminal domain-like protein [Burkholderiales bacterium]